MGKPTPHPLMGFYSINSRDVLAAMARLAEAGAPEASRVITNDELPYHPDQRLRPAGLFSEKFFGPKEARDPHAWGVLECTHPLLHPGLVEAIASLLGCSVRAVEHVAGNRAWIDGDGVHFPPGHPGEASDLDASLEHWPPSPQHCFAESWERDLAQRGIEPTCTFEQWYQAWYEERGIDRKAAELAGDAWKEAAIPHAGTRGLLQALAAHEDACQKRLACPVSGLFVSRLPVPPVNQRPLRHWAGFLLAGADNRCLQSFMYWQQRCSRLVELEAPPIILRNEALMLQHVFDEAFGFWADQPVSEPPRCDEPLQCAEPPAAQPVWPLPESHAELSTPVGMAFWGDDRVLVDFATATLVIDLASGRVGEIFPSAGCGLAGCQDGLASFVSNLDWSFAFRDLSNGRWLSGPVPASCHFVFAEYMEQAQLIEIDSGIVHRLSAVTDYPSQIAVSACGAYLYAADKEMLGMVYRFDGAPMFPLEFVTPHNAPFLWPDDRFEQMHEDRLWILDERVCNEGLAAMAYYPEQELWLRLFEGWLVEGPHGRYRFPFEIRAACFHPKQQRLLVATDSQLLEIGLGERPRILRRLDLSVLPALFVGPGPNNRKPRAKTLNAVLVKYGTLVEAARHEAAELAQLNQESSFEEAKRLGIAKARRVLELAKKVDLPLSVHRTSSTRTIKLSLING